MKVSIITVCLNSVTTIEQTIQSVLEQTYKNIEYIVIDGASTDGTCKIIDKYKEKLAYYVSETDDGIYYAMNKGLRQANGDIVGILNSDDWYTLDTVEKVVHTFERYDCQMVHGKMAMVYDDNEYRIIEERKLSDLFIGMVIAHPTVFVKRRIYEQYGLFDEKYKSAADYELMLRLYAKGISIVFIPEILTYFRRGGYSQKVIKLNMDEAYSIARKYIEKSNDIKKEDLLERIEQNYREKQYRYRIEQVITSLDETEKEELLKEITSGKSIAIFGTGSYGMSCYDLLKTISVDVEAWADNDLSKQGEKIFGRIIYSPNELVKRTFKFIVASKDYECEMVNQLQKLGLDSNDYITLLDLEKVIIGYESK